jgi:predicted alpha/beta-fold hydrolase
MKGSFPDRKILRVFRALAVVMIALPASPLLVASLLVLYIRIRYRGSTQRKKDITGREAVRYNPRVKTMSEAMEILRAIPFGKNVPTPLAKFANWLIETVPIALSQIRGLAGLVYPYPEAFEPVIVESGDGTPLSGVLGMQPGGVGKPALLLVHGLFGTKNTFNIQALARRAYYDWGFHVYAMDLRNFGDSGRFSEAPTSWGYRESDDVLAVAEYLGSIAGVTSVGVYGVSMGAASALLAAGRSSMGRPISGGVVAVSCYADARRAIEKLSGSNGSSHRSVISWFASRLMMSFKTLAGGPRPIGDLRKYTREVAAQYYEISEEDLYRKASPVNFVSEIEVPSLILHAVDDQTVPVAEAYDLVAASVDNPMVDALVVPSGGHAILPLTNPTWFNRVLETFFAYWADFGQEGDQYTGTSGTDTIGTFDNPNN